MFSRRVFVRFYWVEGIEVWVWLFFFGGRVVLFVGVVVGVFVVFRFEGILVICGAVFLLVSILRYISR